MSRATFPDPNLGLAVLNSAIIAGTVPMPDWNAVTQRHPATREHPNPHRRAALLAFLDEHAARLPQLTALHWSAYERVSDRCSGEHYGAPAVWDLTSLAGIEQCAGLRTIRVDGSFGVADLEPLTRLPHLESIDVDHAPMVSDWSPLLRVAALRSVTAPVDPEVAARLTERGVTVRHPAWLAPLVAHTDWPAGTPYAQRLLRLAATDGDHDEEPFPDPNLGLTVLQRLIDQGHVPAPDWKALRQAHPYDPDVSFVDDMDPDDEDFDNDAFQEACAYSELNTEARAALLELLIGHRAQLPDLTRLYWQGGDDVQFACFGYWDGEDGVFDVRSLAGIEQCFGLRDVSLPELDSAGVEHLTGLPKLETLAVNAAPNDTDWSPLLRIPSLRRVKAPVDAAVAERLVERGVDVRTRHRPLPLERLCVYESLRRIADRVLDLPAAERDRWALARCGDDTPDRLETAEELVVARAWLMLGDPGAATEQALTAALLHLATRLDDAGQGHEAAAATDRAVELLRRHDTDLPELGAALELLADRRRPHNAEPGIAALTEASAIFHRLALADPDRYADRFLATNGRLALDREGGVAAGVDAARQRVEVLRALGATDPSYAVLLRLLDDLSGQESGDEATRLEAEAAAVQRELATVHPTFFALRDLARRYRRLGQREDALAAAEQALAAARRPTGDDPATEHRHLAWALQDVVGRLTDLGRHAEALTVAEEQVAHGERGVAAGIASESALVQALHRYGACCNALDRLAESVAVQQRIVDITRRLAETDAWQRLTLAALLTNLGNQLSALGRRPEALEASAEGVERFRELGDDSKLAIAVSNLGIRYGAVGRNEESAVAAAEAVEVARRLVATDPSANEPGLVTALNNLAISLNRLGRHAEAVTAAGEAVETARRRTDNETDVARPLNTLGWSLSQAGEHAAGLTASIEAVAIYRRHAQGDDPLLADALTDHAAIRSRLGQHAEALAATDEAVALYRRLAAAAPGKFGADLARCLSTFAEVRLAAWPELPEPSAAAALAAADEAVSRFAALAEDLPDAHEAELRAARAVQAGIHQA